MSNPIEVNFAILLNEWSGCVTAGYQADRYYRWGKFEDCGPKWEDLKVAMRATMVTDQEKARRMLESTRYFRSKVSPTIGVIWEAKDPPGWD